MLGSHLIDTANYLFGTPQQAWGMAERRYAPTSAEDTGLIHILYPGGVRVAITTLYNSVSTEFINIYGTKGALRYQRWPTQGLHFQPKDVDLAAALYESLPFLQPDDALETFEDFISAIRERRTPETDGRAGLDVVRVLSWILERERMPA
jgi:predicted dehydrogenase